MRKLTITLTGRRPITVYREEWPYIAYAVEKAAPVCELMARAHADGRTVVYGMRYSPGGPDHRRGLLLPATAGEQKVVDAIKEVCQQLEGPAELAQRCIANLAAERI